MTKNKEEKKNEKKTKESRHSHLRSSVQELIQTVKNNHFNNNNSQNNIQNNNNLNINNENEEEGLLFIPHDPVERTPTNFESLIHHSEVPSNIFDNFHISAQQSSLRVESSRAIDLSYSYSQNEVFSPTQMVPQLQINTSMGNVPTTHTMPFQFQSPLPSPLFAPLSPLTHPMPSPTLPTFTPSPQFYESNCKWNDLFQISMKQFFHSDRKKEDYMVICENLASLAKNFVFTATLFGQIIINEFHLPQNKKTYLPCNVGGQAGGIKYIIHDILFKLATDENVMKIAGHELKSLDNLLTCKVSDLCFPMLAIIDYRGFRLIAISTLPIDKTTIKYGSSDGGYTVHNSNPELAEKIKTACSMLNLSSRFVYSYNNTNNNTNNTTNNTTNTTTNNTTNNTTNTTNTTNTNNNINNNVQLNNVQNNNQSNPYSYYPTSASAATPPPSILSPSPPSPLQFSYNNNTNGQYSYMDINSYNPNVYMENSNNNYTVNDFDHNNNNNSNNLTNFYQYSYNPTNHQYYVNNSQIQSNENYKEIYGPIDLEGHLGRDGKFYLVDFSRLFPPDLPQNFNNISSYLFQLLRPEIVKINPYPLCSDALSNFVQNNEEKAKYYHEIQNTNMYLINKRIPNFVEILSRKNPALYQPIHVIQSIHRCGINIRYMGKIRFLLLHHHYQSTYTNDWAQILLIEMICRTLKWNLKDRLRKTSEFNPYQLPIDIPFKQTIVRFMNDIFGDHPSSLEFWMLLESSVQQKFHQDFTFERGNLRGFVFSSTQSISQLFDRFCEMMGIQFSPCVKSNFLLFRHQNPFELAHLKDVMPRVKQLHFVNYCEGISLHLQSKLAPIDTKKYLYQLSLECFERSLECNPSSVDSLLYCAKLNSKLGKLERAKIYYELAMNININDPFPILQFARFCEKVKYDVITAEKYYLLSLQANPNFVQTLLHYARFLTLNFKGENDIKRALVCFWKAKKFITPHSPYYSKLSQYYIAFLRVSLAVKTEDAIQSALHQLMTSS